MGRNVHAHYCPTSSQTRFWPVSQKTTSEPRPKSSSEKLGQNTAEEEIEARYLDGIRA